MNFIKQPLVLWLLFILLLNLGLGGLYGGILMILDPSGKLLGMDGVLHKLLVPNYILPGLFLTFIMGLLPLTLIYTLYFQPNWKIVNKFFRNSNYYSGWICTVLLGIILIVWLLVQMILIGFQLPIQFITLINGLLIIILSFHPSIKRIYKRVIPN